MFIMKSSRSGMVYIWALVVLSTLLDWANGKVPNPSTQPHQSSPRNRPNFVFIYTDDQDDILGSLNAMPNLKKYIMDKGVRFTNSFVSTPLCCPSRSALATGRYAHNTGAVNNYDQCGSDEFIRNELPRTWTSLLQSSGYRTFYAGKYIHKFRSIPNQETPLNPAGGTPFLFDNATNSRNVPPGWDWFNKWSQPNGQKYYNYDMFVNGTKVKFGNESKDYSTTVIQNLALDFLRFTAVDDKPFFIMVAPNAPHAPFLYEPQFDDVFKDVKALKTPSFGKYGADKHWIARSMEKKLSGKSKVKLNRSYRNRWRTLISVDNMILEILNQLLSMRKLDDTIIVFSSDNGFHMGQFNLPMGKRKAYEFDMKVPLIFMGPGIADNKVRTDLVQNIDLGPTFLELAGVEDPRGTWHDGKSMAPLLSPDESSYEEASKNWRKFLLVEYTGECHVKNMHKRGECIDELGNFTLTCECMDSVNNTYSCVRHFDGKAINEVYCEYDDVEQFREYYDLTNDPWQLHNSFNDMSEENKRYLQKQLLTLKSCRGDSCWLQLDDAAGTSKTKVLTIWEALWMGTFRN